MHRVKRRKGQFIVAAAMFIALIILSMSLMIYSAGSRYQVLEKEPVREIVQTITDDFKRMLTVAIVDYCNDVNYIVSQTEAERGFRNTVFSWVDKTLYCYSGMGLQLGVTIDENPYCMPEEYPIEIEDSFEIGASATLSLNIASVGFYGYVYPAQVKLNVTMDEVLWSFDETGITFLNITVKAFREGNLSVSDLEITGLTITVDNGTDEEEIDIFGQLNPLYSSEDRIYIVTLNNTVKTSFDTIERLKARLEFLDGRGIWGAVQKEGENVFLMYVYNITMKYEIVQNKHYINVNVMIVNVLGEPVSGATVYLCINSSSDHVQTEEDGVAKFIFKLKSAPKNGDTFIATVEDVVKKGYFYDPSRNVATEATLTIKE